jgi:hypothetical protein
MKHCLVTFAALLVAASTYAQGTVNFVNRITGTLDARVFYAATPSPMPADSTYWAQLYAAPVGGTLAAVGDPIPFRDATEAQKGYWAGATRTIPGVAESGTAQVQAVAWLSSLGNDYAAVKAAGLGGWGESAVLTVTTGGGLTPPAPLVGLTGFTVSAVIPEPSIAALGLLGAGLLLIRRKK